MPVRWSSGSTSRGLLDAPVDGLAEALHQALVERALIRPPPALVDRVAELGVAGTSVSLREAARATGWNRVEEDLRAAVAHPNVVRLVVALDEVPWWLDAITETSDASAARSALATLRRLRQTPPLDEKLRMVLTGSIGLAGLAATLNASAELNDLHTVEVPPMTEDEGAALFESEVTARGTKCTSEAARQATQLAGGSPHWLKVLASNIGQSGASRAEDIDAAAEKLLVPQQRQLFADEGQEHFRRRHADLYPALIAILDAMSDADHHPLEAAVSAALAADPGLSRRRAEECVWLLVDGFYLHLTGSSLAWVNPLFRRWWLKYGGA